MRWKLVWTAPIGEVCWPETFDTEHDAQLAVVILKQAAGWTSVRVEPVPCTPTPAAG